MFLCYFWLIASILLFFLITECTKGDGPHAVGPTIWQLFSRHKPAYSSFPHETCLQDSTFFTFFLFFNYVMTSAKSKTHIISIWGQAVLLPYLLSTFIPTRLPVLLSRVAQVLIWYLVICFISPGIGFWNYYSCCVCTGIISGIMCYSVWVIVLEFGIFLGARAYLLLFLFCCRQ